MLSVVVERAVAPGRGLQALRGQSRAQPILAHQTTEHADDAAHDEGDERGAAADADLAQAAEEQAATGEQAHQRAHDEERHQRQDRRR